MRRTYCLHVIRMVLFYLIFVICYCDVIKIECLIKLLNTFLITAHSVKNVLESAAARPRLKLLPRSKPKEETVDAVTTQMRNTSIFGAGKPREAQPDDYVAPTDSTSNPSRSRNTSESQH